MNPFTVIRWRKALQASRRAVPCALIVLLGISDLGDRSAWAQTTYGTLSNFDVFNDTGQECHGFEIELDGLSSSDVTFTFGAPYQRYGNPSVVDFPGGVYIRYESPYDSTNHVFTATTPLAPSVITPTNGHACWTGGAPGYETAGCEHFGVGYIRTPTNTAYRWLIADPNNPGALQPSGTKVSIPAPVWNVSPPPGGGAPAVQAVLPAEPPENEAQFGDAMWVKVFVTESPDPVELHHLVTDDPVVPQEASETETEWVILQAGPPGQAENELVSEGQAGADAEAVTRRYEFYEYTGAYDPESHEVLCGGDGSCNMPLEGELGNYIGAQMAAINLAAIELPTPTATATETPTVPTETPTSTQTAATSTPSPTGTLPPDTATPTATQPLPTATPTDTAASSTPTPTEAEIPPTTTATALPLTATPTLTETAAPPTATATETPSASPPPASPSVTPTIPAPTPTQTAPQLTGTPTSAGTATATHPLPPSSPSATAAPAQVETDSCAITPAAGRHRTGGWLALAGMALIGLRRRRGRGSTPGERS